MLLLDLLDSEEREDRPKGPVPIAGPLPGYRLPLPFPLSGANPLPLPPASGLLPTGPASLTAPWPEGRNVPPWVSGAPLPWPAPGGFPAPASRHPIPVLLELLRRAFPETFSPGPAAVPSAMGPRPPQPMPFSGESERLPLSEPYAQTAAAEGKPKDPDAAPVAGVPRPATPPIKVYLDADGAPLPPKQAAAIAPRNVEIDHGDGVIEIRSGGSRSWRNHNPANLRYGREEHARRNGAIGFDKNGFAIFPDEETGKRAAMASLRSPAYQARTINEAIAKWAPKSENDTAAYQRFVQTQVSMPGDTRLSALTPQQLERLYGVIKRYEGWKAGDPSFHGDRR